MLNVDALEASQVSLTALISGNTFVAGRAVKLGSTGVTVPTAATRVLGLAKENYISGVVNELTGQYGVGNSSKITVVTRGVVTVQQSSYSGVSYAVYDQTLTYAAGEDLYCTVALGSLTNVQPAGTGPNGLTSLRIGRVLVAPINPANGDPMQINVECA